MAAVLVLQQPQLLVILVTKKYGISENEWSGRV